MYSSVYILCYSMIYGIYIRGLRSYACCGDFVKAREGTEANTPSSTYILHVV